MKRSHGNIICCGLRSNKSPNKTQPYTARTAINISVKNNGVDSALLVLRQSGRISPAKISAREYAVQAKHAGITVRDEIRSDGLVPGTGIRTRDLGLAKY